jgi:glycerol kinase
VRAQLCRNLKAGADEQTQELAYENIMCLAEQAPAGANRLFFRIDQQTAALGAAALAAVGTGMWPNFSRIKELHAIQDVSSPIPANVEVYEAQLPIFKLAAQQQSELGSMIRQLKNYDA